MSIAAFAVICATAVTLGDINVVQIGPLLRVDRADFEAGIINGQSFTLGPNTVFNVVDRGVIANMGPAETALDFNGSTIVLNEGGRLETGALAAVNIDVRDLAIVGNRVTLIDRSYIEVNGGRVGFLLELIDSDGAVYDGFVGGIQAGFELRGDSTLTVDGGETIGGSVRTGSRLITRSGTLGFGWGAEAGAVVDFYGGFIDLPKNGTSIDAEYNIRGGRFSTLLPHIWNILRPNVFAHDTGRQRRATWYALENGGAYIAEEFFDLALNVVSVNPPDLDLPIVVDGTGSTSSALDGLGPREHVILREGGELGRRYTSVGGTIEIEGGIMGPDVIAFDSTLRMTGGEFLGPAEFEGCNLVLTGGRFGAVEDHNDSVILGDNFSLEIDGAELTGTILLGGFLIDDDPVAELEVRSGLISADLPFTNQITRARISGGDFIGEFSIFANTSMRIEGGSFQPPYLSSLGAVSLRVLGGNFSSTTRLFGERVDMFIRDESIAGVPLAINQTRLTPRGERPDAVTLADGSVFTEVTELSSLDGLIAFTRIDPTRCSEADLAAPTGTLDIADIVEFLNLYQAQSVLADLAEPYERFEIGDVVAFLQLFGDGCP